MKHCPHCNIVLTAVDYEGFRVFQCPHCSGHLVSLPRLESIKRVANRTKEELQSEAAAQFHGSGTVRVRCPRCRMPMRKRAIKLPGLAIHVDVCHACALAWLDGGELALAQLGHETTARFADAQELRRRMAELESSPARKAALEESIARLPQPLDPIEEALGEVGEELLDEILRGLLRARHK